MYMETVHITYIYFKNDRRFRNNNKYLVLLLGLLVPCHQVLLSSRHYRAPLSCLVLLSFRCRPEGQQALLDQGAPLNQERLQGLGFLVVLLGQDLLEILYDQVVQVYPINNTIQFISCYHYYNTYQYTQKFSKILHFVEGKLIMKCA